MSNNFDVSYWSPKDPSSVEPYFVVWCDEDGDNTGASTDKGELQGATIASVTWTVPSGVTKDSDNRAAVTIHGRAYAINTVCTIWLSGGSADNEYTFVCAITTSDSPARTLVKRIILPVRTLV